MEQIYGKSSRSLSGAEQSERVAGYHDILIDIGTGDGR